MNKTEIRNAREMEIFNSMPHNTFDEVMEVANKINDYRDICESYDSMLLVCDTEIEKATSLYNDHKEDYETFKQIMSSRIHQLISEFVNNKSETTLNEIRRELEESGNPFGIIINDKQEEVAKNAKGELAYGFICDNHFSIKSTNTYYTFDNYDIVEDMERCLRSITSSKNILDKVTERKCQIETEGEYTLWSRCRGGGAWYDETWWYYNGEEKWNY